METIYKIEGTLAPAQNSTTEDKGNTCEVILGRGSQMLLNETSPYLYLQQNELHVGNCDTLQRIYLNTKDRYSL